MGFLALSIWFGGPEQVDLPLSFLSTNLVSQFMVYRSPIPMQSDCWISKALYMFFLARELQNIYELNFKHISVLFFFLMRQNLCLYISVLFVCTVVLCMPASHIAIISF